MTGIIANPNLDDKGQKAERMRNLEESFDYAIRTISHPETEEEKNQFKDDPFFAAMKLPDIEVKDPTPEEIEELREKQEEFGRIYEELDQT